MSVSRKVLEVLPPRGLIVMLGAPGAGKSALGYALLEDLQPRQSCVYGFPLEKAPLLPDSIKLLTSLDFPEESIVLCDEAYISFYARQFMSERNKVMDTLSGLARQKGILLIYITQSTRKLDVGLVAGAEALLIKRPSLLQMKLDRGELRGTLVAARSLFFELHPPPDVKLKTYQQRCTYILSDDFEGMIELSNTPPSFWSEGLSRAFQGVPLAQRVDAEESQLSNEEQVEQLRQQAHIEHGENLKCAICEQSCSLLLNGTCDICFQRWALSALRKV